MFWIHAQCISTYEIRPNLPGPDMLQLCGLGTPMSVSQVWIEVNPPILSNPIHRGWSCSVQASHQPSFSWMYILFVFSHFLWGILHFCTNTIVMWGFPPNLGLSSFFHARCRGRLRCCRLRSCERRCPVGELQDHPRKGLHRPVFQRVTMLIYNISDIILHIVCFIYDAWLYDILYIYIAYVHTSSYQKKTTIQDSWPVALVGSSQDWLCQETSTMDCQWLGVSWWHPIINYDTYSELFQKNLKISPENLSLTLEVGSLSLLLLCSYLAWSQYRQRRELQLELAKQRRED